MTRRMPNLNSRNSKPAAAISPAVIIRPPRRQTVGWLGSSGAPVSGELSP